MQVINKVRFLICAGFLISALYLLIVSDPTRLAPRSISSAHTHLDKDEKSKKLEDLLKEPKIESALNQLRQNINLSTSDLLASSAEY